MSDREKLTAAEVAGLLRCTTQTVCKLFRRGELEGFRLGPRVRIYRDSVEAYVASRSNRPAPAPPAPATPAPVTPPRRRGRPPTQTRIQDVPHVCRPRIG